MQVAMRQHRHGGNSGQENFYLSKHRQADERLGIAMRTCISPVKVIYDSSIGD